MIEAHLKEWLVTDPAVNAYIEGRVYPQFAPESSANPAIVYSVISDQATLGMTGPLSVRNPRVQLSLIAESQKSVSELAEVVKQRINTWDYIYPDMHVTSCFAEGGVYLSLDYYTPPKYGMIIEAFLNWVPI